MDRPKSVHTDRPAAGSSGGEDERALLDRLQSGDEAAFAEIVQRYGGQMLATARRILRDEDDARDCVQEAMVAAMRSIDRFEGRSRLSTWLHRVVVNTSLTHLRSQKRRKEESIEPLLPEFDAMGCRIELPEEAYLPIDELIDQARVRDIVRRAIDEMPETYRLVLLLRDIEELSVQETADALEISPGAVKTRLHRARSALKKLLESTLLGELPE